MRLMSAAPLASRAVMVKAWVAVLVVAGVAEARVGGCWAPVFQVLAVSQPVPRPVASTIQAERVRLPLA
jgi:hypothetical protein